MRIVIAADHAGYALKQLLIFHLRELGYVVEDQGAFEDVPDDDYPDFVSLVGKLVSSDPAQYRGIVIGGSGQGEAICVNRYPHVRAAVLYHFDEQIVRLSRLHNDANVLALGARFLSPEEAQEAVELWLATEFSKEERHERRNQKIDNQTAPQEHEF